MAAKSSACGLPSPPTRPGARRPNSIPSLPNSPRIPSPRTPVPSCITLRGTNIQEATIGLNPAIAYLRCPICRQPLSLAAAGKTVGCPQRHSFDVARSGYVNLARKTTPRNADSAVMVAARQRFLGTGAYAPIAAAVTAAALGQQVLEVGAGPAYYLAHCVSAVPGRQGLAIDVSPAAAKVAARVHPRIAAVVADIWDGLPLVDATATTLLCVFAPRNLPEFVRLLAPGGRLVTVVPNPQHLAQLRRHHSLIDIHPDKVDHLIATAPAALTHLETIQLEYEYASATAAVRDLIVMGPNGFHAPALEEVTASSIDINVSIIIWQRN